jgi:hypothetical protein
LAGISALMAASAIPAAFGAPSSTAGFSGQVCSLLTPSELPHGVSTTCRQGKLATTDPGATTYDGKWGAAGLRLEIKVITFATAAARSTGLSDFKQEVSILPQIGIPVSVVKVGTWARESVNAEAPAAVTLQFVAGGDNCIVYILDVPAGQDSVYRADALAVAKAVAAKLE